MATVFVGKKAKAAYSYDVDAGRYTLQTDKSVKVSCHINIFKDKEIMFKYLNWLFGEGKWSTCGTEILEEGTTMTAYYIVDNSTDALNKEVQFFGVAVEDDYSSWPLGYARLDHIGYWTGNFDTKSLCEKSIDDLIRRIHKRKGINCDVHYMTNEEFRELTNQEN